MVAPILGNLHLLYVVVDVWLCFSGFPLVKLPRAKRAQELLPTIRCLKGALVQMPMEKGNGSKFRPGECLASRWWWENGDYIWLYGIMQDLCRIYVGFSGIQEKHWIFTSKVSRLLQPIAQVTSKTSKVCAVANIQHIDNIYVYIYIIMINHPSNHILGGHLVLSDHHLNYWYN